jgi:hypothetical protein
MQMAEDRERAIRRRAEEALALKSASSTPRIASVGGIAATPKRTPRRVGL